MKKLIGLLFSILVLNFSNAQNSLVKKWDYRYGGTMIDELTSIVKTSDGGYILGGSSNSNISGDKSQNNWEPFFMGNDYWIVKIDSSGQIQWDKDFGGSGGDNLVACIETKDGGFILGGTSSSDAGGNKSEDNLSLAPWTDYWIIKINANGEQQWDKTIGGIFSDNLSKIQQTIDGGFILGGSSESSISGDKTEDTWGNTGLYDYWIVKIDSLGVKEWDKTIGGTGSDYFNSLQQTIDGGYILGGYSDSGISGNKSQDTWGGTGKSDYWIVKIDAEGNKQWDMDYGGVGIDLLQSLVQTRDGGYVLAGSSNSNISGNKSEKTWGNGEGYDFWIIKINSAGEIEWDRDFGGTKDEEFGNISELSDGGYIIAGTSYSPISGNKTEDNLGEEQTWVIKLNSQGHLQWDKTLRTTGHDESGFAIQSSSNCYLMGNGTGGSIGGDKSQPCWDTTTMNSIKSDFWVTEFCESPTTIVNELDSNNYHIEIGPNPFNNAFSVSFSNDNWQEGTLTMSNSLGELVYHTKLEKTDAQTKSIEVSFLPNGIYFLYMNFNNYKTVKKIIKI